MLFRLLFVWTVLVATSMGFAPLTSRHHGIVTSSSSRPTSQQLFLNIGERERDGLTRDNEPEEFFAT